MIELNLTKSEPSLCQFDFEAVCIHKGELEEGLKVRVAHVAKNRDCGTLGHKSLAERFKPSRTQDFQKSSTPRLRRRQDCWRQADIGLRRAGQQWARQKKRAGNRDRGTSLMLFTWATLFARLRSRSSGQDTLMQQRTVAMLTRPCFCGSLTKPAQGANMVVAFWILQPA